VANMKSSLPKTGAQTERGKSLVGISPQKQTTFGFVPGTFLEWRDIGYRALQEQVAESYPTQGEYADVLGQTNGDTSLRLRRGDDDHGRPQRAFLEMVMALAMKPGGLEGFCARVLREKRMHLEPDELPTETETIRGMAAFMSEKQRRAVERDHGWPEGWLDR